MAQVTHEALYHKLVDDSVRNRAEQYAHWTLPYLMPDAGEVASTGRVVVERDFQEVGALLVNNLSAKLTRLLFPQYPFFQTEVSPKFEQHSQQLGIAKNDLRGLLAQMEMACNKRLFSNAGYASLILALKHLMVTGSAVVYRNSEEGTLTTYGLNSFGIRRDSSGVMLDLVIREFTTVEALPIELQSMLRTVSSGKYGRPECQIKKYTRVHRKHREGVVGYEVSQQIDTYSVGDSTWYPAALCPFLTPTWTLIPGEHYGRGIVEEYAGGFARLSSLSEASALYGVEIMRVLHMVGAGAGGDIDEMAEAESGEWVRGDPNTVAAYEAGDSRKLEQVERQIEGVSTRLARAFMYQANQRDAERVTKFELQQDAQEAEHTLGGVYSTLSGGIQVPLANLLIAEVAETIQVGLVTGDVRPDVIAGIPALGRSTDVQNIIMASQEIVAVVPSLQMDKRINPSLVVDVIMAGRSIDTNTIFYTPEQQRQNAEAEQAMQNAQMAAAQAQVMAGAGEQLGELSGG